MGTNRWTASGALVTLLATLVIGTVGPPTAAGAAEASLTFECTGGPQDWEVPAGVTEAQFDLHGAQGGHAEASIPGGLGGRTTATIEVTPGETLRFEVGCQGGNGVVGAGGDGGYNGGGEGGDPPVGVGVGGGGGGGASDVRRDGTGLVHRILVAGGGGGGATGAQAAGGHGGGTAGGDGQDHENDTVVGGGGASGTTGGTAGTPGGIAGSTGLGGEGGDNPGASTGHAGGGGGGGLAGGGGGGYDAMGWGASGGGGGSGSGPAGATLASGEREGDGRITITYEWDAPGPPGGVTVRPGVTTALVSWSPPTDPGTAPITGYVVSAQPGSHSESVGLVDQVRLGGLEDGQTYTFFVEAVSSAGTGVAAASPPVTLGFTDVPPGPPPAAFYEDIAWLADNGVTGGFPDGTFRPTVAVSRQSMAAFLYRFLGEPDGPDPACSAPPFDDVPVDHQFCGEIDWMVDAGVTGGYPDGTFRPTLAVSRQSMAAFLHRLASPSGPEPACSAPPFDDVPVDHRFCGEIDWMVDANIASGFSDGTFRPTRAVSRQAMAKFLHLFADLV